MQAIGGILILGIFQMAIAYIFMTKGLEQVSAVTASLTTAIEPILNPLLVAMFWGEMVTPLSLAGATIVIVSIVGYNLIKVKTAT
ncbi:MAG: EamA family transporter [Lachnospiraceae bacterium]|nr:EamA family transporter [Lachnospiraceae bacterium]